MFPSRGEWIQLGCKSIPPQHGSPEPVRDADWEVTLPPTFDEIVGLLLTRPRVGERLRFTSRQDSNTIMRSWHRASLSDRERAGEPVEAWETQRERWTQAEEQMHGYFYKQRMHQSTHGRGGREDGKSKFLFQVCLQSFSSRIVHLFTPGMRRHMRV